MTNEERTRIALRTVNARRQKAVTQAQQRLDEVRARLPQLAELERQHTQAGIEAARLAASGAARAEIDAALARAAELDQERIALLKNNGITPESLQPAYTCPLCSDTGRGKNGLCQCVQDILRQMRQDEVNETSPLLLCSFDTFDLNKYPNTLVPELGITARAHMQSIYTYCRDYALHFSLDNPSLYLYGYAGLGKTHLALSIAQDVLHKGFNVVYASAQNAFSTIEKEHFSGEGETMSTLCNAELLILDDIGTEYISPFVSSSFYSLINTRVCRHLPTIYTSNIVNDADLQRRYTEKIVSRLLGSCECLSFCGDDIRLQGK